MAKTGQKQLAMYIRFTDERELQQQIEDIYEVPGPDGALALFHTRRGSSVLATPLVRVASDAPRWPTT